MSSNLIKHVLPSALVVCKNKSYHRYHLGLCQQPILPNPFYLSSPLCLTCLSFPSSVLFLCLTCSRRLFVPKCQEGKAVIYWKILLDSWPAVWNVRAELFTVKEEEEKRISIPTIPWLWLHYLQGFMLSATLPHSVLLQGLGASAADLHVRSSPVKAEGNKAFLAFLQQPRPAALSLEVSQQWEWVVTGSHGHQKQALLPDSACPLEKLISLENAII